MARPERQPTVQGSAPGLLSPAGSSIHDGLQRRRDDGREVEVAVNVLVDRPNDGAARLEGRRRRGDRSDAISLVVRVTRVGAHVVAANHVEPEHDLLHSALVGEGEHVSCRLPSLREFTRGKARQATGGRACSSLNRAVGAWGRTLVEYTRSWHSSRMMFDTWSHPLSVPTIWRPSYVITDTTAAQRGEIFQRREPSVGD